MKWWHWIVVAALLLAPMMLSAYNARFMAVIDCGSLKGAGTIHLRDRQTTRGYRIDVNCSTPLPGAVFFL